MQRVEKRTQMENAFCKGVPINIILIYSIQSSAISSPGVYYIVDQHCSNHAVSCLGHGVNNETVNKDDQTIQNEPGHSILQECINPSHSDSLFSLSLEAKLCK